MQRLISGIKPTGKLTLGNYIGAIRQFVNLQNDYESILFIANLHAITVDIDKSELKKNTRDLCALYLAAGLDPEKTTIFVQSDVLEHGTLGFIMTCNSYMGELSRMTQYKDKASKTNNIGTGIFTYPTLMAADILLYNANIVPVGEDQKQHVELTRDLAIRFNNKYGETFVVPEPIIAKTGARIMSLSNPLKKMSKSEEDGDKGCIYLLDEPRLAKKKIMSAVTDSDTHVKYDPVNKPGISNLLTIQSCLTGETIEELEERYKDSNYAQFKDGVGTVVENFLMNLQLRYYGILETGLVDKVLEEGANRAHYMASKTLSKVYKRLGFNYKK